MNAQLEKPIAAAKLQHHVIYVSDLQTIEGLLYEALRPAVLRAQSSRQQRGHAAVQSWKCISSASASITTIFAWLSITS